MNTSTAKPANLFSSLLVFYFGLPVILFFSTWLRPEIGIPSALVVAWGCFKFSTFAGEALPHKRLDRKNLVFVLALGLFWAALCGIGGITPQSADYQKHNILFHDLTSKVWPITYDTPEKGAHYLCYALGYYLVPSLGAHFLGEMWLGPLSYAWAALGICLFFYWLATLTDNPKATVLGALLFSGAGLLWYFVKYGHFLPFLFHGKPAEVFTQLGLIHSYLDPFSRLNFAPQHAITGWAGVALMYDACWTRKDPRGIVFAWALTLLWSPLTSIALLIIPIAAMGKIPIPRYFEKTNIIGGGICMGLLGIYLQGHVPMMDKGFIWDFSNHGNWVSPYFAFLIFNLLPLIFVALLDYKYDVLKDIKPLFIVSCLLLMLLPLYKLGFHGDLRLQMSSPALVMGAVCTMHILFKMRNIVWNPTHYLLVASLAIGAVYPVLRPIQNILFNKEDYSYAHFNARGIQDLSHITDGDFDVSSQYLGDTRSVAYKIFLKKSSFFKPQSE